MAKSPITIEDRRQARLAAIDELIDHGLTLNTRTVQSLRSALRSQLRSSLTVDFPFERQLDQLRTVLVQFEPQLALVLGDTMTGSAVLAIEEVIDSLPDEIVASMIERARTGSLEAAVGPGAPGPVFGTPPPPAPPLPGPPLPFESPFAIRLPRVDQAVRSLLERGVMTRREFDDLAAADRQYAFTVAGQDSIETLDRIRQTLANVVETGPSLRRFNESLDEALAAGESPFRPDHRELVYRANIQTAYKQGMDRLLDDPLVGTEFPYMIDASIPDSRRTTVCGWFSVNGEGGTNIYRRDDPVYRRYQAPRHFGCRTTGVVASIDDAAARGSREARLWLQGETPLQPFRMENPPPEIVEQMWF